MWGATLAHPPAGSSQRRRPAGISPAQPLILGRRPALGATLKRAPLALRTQHDPAPPAAGNAQTWNFRASMYSFCSSNCVNGSAAVPSRRKSRTTCNRQGQDKRMHDNSPPCLSRCWGVGSAAGRWVNSQLRPGWRHGQPWTGPRQPEPASVAVQVASPRALAGRLRAAGASPQRCGGWSRQRGGRSSRTEARHPRSPAVRAARRRRATRQGGVQCGGCGAAASTRVAHGLR